MKAINLEHFYEAITRYNMKDIWREGLFTINEEDKENRASLKEEEALNAFTRMMRSKSNDGSGKYLNWATTKALDLPVKGKRGGGSDKDKRRNRNLS